MALWNASFEVEQVKKLALVAGLSTHHGKPPPPNLSRQRNHCSPISAKPFSTASTQSGALSPSIDALQKVYSITSSAIASTPGGMVSPSAFAVLRLIISSNFDTLSTGRSAGFSPL